MPPNYISANDMLLHGGARWVLHKKRKMRTQIDLPFSDCDTVSMRNNSAIRDKKVLM